MGVILFPPGANFLKKIAGWVAGIKPRVVRSCTVNTSTGGALLGSSQRARATFKSWAVRELRRSGAGLERPRRQQMPQNEKDEILHDHNHDGIDRRGFLKCMAWAGTGALCVMQGGVLKSYSLSSASDLYGSTAKGELSFVQISDRHMGFNKPANPDVAGTLKAAVDKINGLSMEPEFFLQTGDITH